MTSSKREDLNTSFRLLRRTQPGGFSLSVTLPAHFVSRLGWKEKDYARITIDDYDTKLTLENAKEGVEHNK